MSAPASGVLAGAPVLQTRGIGVLEAIRDGLPSWAVDGFAVLTTLGDTAVLLALAVGIYLAYDRRDGAFVLGTLFVAFGVIIAAKSWFALPRPPAELHAVAAYGFGFPSGHAVGATVGWGAMAIALERLWTRERRLALAALVAGTVALSRVVIGVHYLVDVVVGVLVGVGVLLVVTRWFREEPLGTFVLAGGVSLLAVAASGAGVESVALLGAVAGATVAWQLVDPTTRPYGRPGLMATGGLGVALAAGAAFAAPASGLAFAGAWLVALGVLLAPMAWAEWLPR